MEAAKHETESRRAKAEALAHEILKDARAVRKPLMGVFPKNDVEWWRVWSAAKCASAPSEETKAETRNIIEHWALVIDTAVKAQQKLASIARTRRPTEDESTEATLAYAAAALLAPSCPDCGGEADKDGEFEHQQGCGWGIQPVAVRS